MNWKTMAVSIVAIAMFFGFAGAVVISAQDVQRRYIEKGYTKTTLPGAEMSVWIKPPQQSLNKQYVLALNALTKRVNKLEARDVGTKKGRR